MTIQLSEFLQKSALEAIQLTKMKADNNSLQLIEILGTPFWVGSMALVDENSNFLLHGVIKDPLTGEYFGVGVKTG